MHPGELVLDGIYKLGLASNNCQGTLFLSVPADAAGFQTSVVFYPLP